MASAEPASERSDQAAGSSELREVTRTQRRSAASVPASELRRAAAGGAWLAAGQSLGKGASFLATLVLARLLSPEDFGLVAMATVVLGFVATFSDLGLTAALIQRRDLQDVHKDAAFYSSLVMGVGLFALMTLAAPWLASFYRDERVTGIVIGASISLLLGPLWSTHASLLRRELELGTVAKIELLRGIGGALASIAGAFAGLGYYAIVIGPLVGHVLALSACLRSVSFRPARRASLRHARELFSFGLFVAGATSVNYLSANLDYLIVGKVLGAAALGTYMLAYQLVTFPLSRISSLFHQAMFPAFSALRDDLPALRESYVGMHRAVGLIALPVVALIAVAAPELVRIAFGPEWLAAAPLVVLLALAGALKSLGTLVGIVFKARGKPEVELYWNLVWSAVVAGVVLLGVRHGTQGVAIAISLACVPGVLYTEHLACAYLGLPLSRLLRALVLPAGATLLAAALGFALRSTFEPATTGLAITWLRLLSLVVLVLGAYTAILRALHPGIAAEARAFLRHFRRQS